MSIFRDIWRAISNQHIPVGMTYRCVCGSIHLTGQNCPEALKARRKVSEEHVRAAIAAAYKLERGE